MDVYDFARQVPGTRRGTNSSNRGPMGCNRNGDLPRIGTRGTKSGRCLGRDGEERTDLKALGRRLTNRDIYNYFNERIVVKSHKLDGIIRRHCLAIELWEIWRNPLVIYFAQNSQFSKKGQMIF